MTAFYSIIHVPREKHGSLFDVSRRILRPDGVMLACVGAARWEATDEYIGTTMFWSPHNPQRALQLVKNAGFRIVSDQILVRGAEKHYWITAKGKKQRRWFQNLHLF